MASKLVLLLVLVFDFIAFGLAVAAEQRRSTARVLPDSEVMYSYCVYDSDVATGLGVGSLLFLLLSQVVVSKCFCCGRGLSPGGPRACALVLFLFLWLTFLIALACLLAGSVRNAHHIRYRSMFFNGNQHLLRNAAEGRLRRGRRLRPLHRHPLRVLLRLLQQDSQRLRLAALRRA